MGTYTPYNGLKMKPRNIRGYIGIIRHGTRYPTKNVYGQFPDSLQKKVGEKDIGELHSRGAKEMIAYGKSLKDLYPSIFNNPNNVIVYSTQMQRAIDSGKFTLDGLGYKNKEIVYGKEIDQFLKLKHILKEKPDHNPEIISCQFAKALDLPLDKSCENLDYSLTEKNIHTYETIQKTKEKGRPFFNHLQEKIKTMKDNQAYLYFCHDSTLAPIYALLDVLPEKSKYRNEDWIPFSARLEILLEGDKIRYFANGREVWARNGLV
jgi:hypothetical protein